MKKTLIILYLLFPYMLFAQSNMEVRNETIYSEAFAQERSFRIAMPKNMQSDTKYNLLFVLDADYVFDVAAATAIYGRCGCGLCRTGPTSRDRILAGDHEAECQRRKVLPLSE